MSSTARSHPFHRHPARALALAAALELWMAVERLDDGRVWVPWDEISVDLQLPQAVAA